MRPEIGILRLTVASTPDELRAGEHVQWTFTVSNIGAEPCRLTFTSGQQGDVVLEADGAERYRWSSDKYFTAAITEREVPALSDLTFELDDVLSVEPGTYALRASVKCQPAPPPVRREIVVAPAAGGP
jgi:Intracellular proteinase inhibitor